MKVVAQLEVELDEDKPDESTVTMRIEEPEEIPEGWTPKALAAAIAVTILYNSQPHMLDMNAMANGIVNEDGI
jgi:hypothetical protein